MDINDMLTHTGRLKELYKPRNKRIEEYYRLRDLDPRTYTGQPLSGVENEPKVVINLAKYFIAGNQEQFRLPISTEDEVERDLLSKAERALMGIASANDMMLFESMLGNSWMEIAADLALMSGHLYDRCLVIPGEDGYPNFIADNLMPQCCYAEGGLRGLRRFLHEYETSIAVIEDLAYEYGFKSGWKDMVKAKAKTARLSEYYEKHGEGIISYTVMVDDRPVLEKDYAGGTKGLFKNIPIKGGSVGYADRSRQTYANHQGEGFLEPIVDLVDRNNILFSYQLIAAKRAIMAPIIVKSNRGQAVIAQKDFDDGGIEFLQNIKQILEGEDIQVLNLVPNMPDLSFTSSKLAQDIQKATFSPLVFGGTGGIALSGYAIQQLNAGVLANIGSYRQLVITTRAQILRDWMLMYRDGPYGSKPITFEAYDSKLQGYGHEEFTQEEALKLQFLRVNVTTPLALPRNIIEQLTAMRQAIPQGPLTSLTWGWDNLMEGVQDTELMKKQIMEDAADQVMAPINMAARVMKKAAQFDKDGNPEGAQMARRVAETMLASIGQQAQGGQQGVRPQEGGLGMARPTPSERRGMEGTPPSRPNRAANSPQARKKRLANAGVL